MKNSNDTIWNRTRDLPICAAAVPLHYFVEKIIEELENFKSEKKPGTDGLTIDGF